MIRRSNRTTEPSFESIFQYPENQMFFVSSEVTVNLVRSTDMSNGNRPISDEVMLTSTCRIPHFISLRLSKISYRRFIYLFLASVLPNYFQI